MAATLSRASPLRVSQHPSPTWYGSIAAWPGELNWGGVRSTSAPTIRQKLPIAHCRLPTLATPTLRGGGVPLLDCNRRPVGCSVAPAGALDPTGLRRVSRRWSGAPAGVGADRCEPAGGHGSVGH